MWAKIARHVLWLSVTGIFLGCASIPPAPSHHQTATEAPADTGIVEVSILHWNDLHSANIPSVPSWRNHQQRLIGGCAALAGYIDSLKAIYPRTITLNAGDDFQGSPISSFTKGRSQIRILNEIRPDAFTIGNHEFDYGIDNLRANLKAAEFPIVSANLFDSTRNALLVDPFILIEENNLQVAVIGLIMADLKSTVLPQNISGISVLDPLKATKIILDRVKDRADLIVLLTHQGFREDSLLALQLQAVDVIVGGHSHTTLRKPVMVNHILICQAGSRGRYLGQLNARVDLAKNSIAAYDYQLIETVVEQIRENEKVKTVVDSLESTIESEMNRQIGVLENDWIRSGRHESNIGNWITDALREKFGTDIALHNSGGIRKNLGAGPITVRDVWEISPFDNTIEIISLSGSQLLQALKWRVENPRDLLQASGIRRTCNYATRQLIKASVHDQAIDPNRRYSIATNNYVVGHLQRFLGLSPEEVEIKQTGIIGRDVLIEAIEKQKTIRSDIENRLVIINR